jgi:4-hydroxy-L-threonine phosphate dehydrogenase PdxA
MHLHNSRTISDSPHNAGYDYLDELEYMAHITHSKNTTVIGVIDQFWTIAVTEHLPFREIADMITKDKVSKCIAMSNDTLKITGKRKPRLAVAALNVHAGEGGLFGNEEIEEISPAIETARSIDILADGPFPADTIFVTALNKKYDGVVCMYHDQANIPRKLLATRTGVTLYIGLPVPRSTTAHGTAFDITGKGIADPGSLANGLKFTAMLAG